MTPDILCIGSVLWDIIGRTPAPMQPGEDLPGRITRVPGGVALNIALTLARLGLRPAVLTAIGRDSAGDDLIAALARAGIDCSHAFRPDHLPTDCYLAIEGANGLIAAIADAHSLEAAGDRILAPLADGRFGTAAAPWAGTVALDGNLTAALLAGIARSPLFAAADMRVAPASPGKAERLRPLLGHPRLSLYVNLQEAGILCGTAFATAPAAAEGLFRAGARRVLVTDGAREAADRAGAGLIAAMPPVVPVHRVTGAGDTFMAAHIVAECAGAGREAALQAGLDAAARHISRPD